MVIQRMAGTAFLLAVLAAFAPATTHAVRQPTAEESAAILATDSRRAECLTATVSTVNPAWALIADADNDTCWSEGRLSIVTRSSSGDWEVWRTGEDLPDVACDEIDVPEKAGRDLGACTPPRRVRFYLPCGTNDGVGEVELTTRPRQCNNAGFQTSNAEMWILRSLRWRSWGRQRAVATGLKFAVHLYPGYAGRPVRVTAFRLSTGCGPDTPYYTRLRFNLPAWTMRSRPFSGGPWRHTRMPAVSYVVKAYPPACSPANRDEELADAIGG